VVKLNNKIFTPFLVRLNNPKAKEENKEKKRALKEIYSFDSFIRSNLLKKKI